MENIKLEVSDTNKDTEEVTLINDLENNNTETSESVETNNTETSEEVENNNTETSEEVDTNNVAEVNDPDAKLSNNDAIVILQIIEIIQSRGKIPANNMFITGQRYLRLKSYIEFNKLSEEKQNEIINEDEDAEKPKYLKNLEIIDLVFYFNFIDRHKKQTNFKEEELEIINAIYKKIYNSLKPFIKEETDTKPQSNDSFNPLATIKEEKEELVTTEE